MKLCILGGGGFRTPFVWQALLRDTGHPRVDRVSLYDTDPVRLKVIVEILRQLAAGFPDAPMITATTNLDQALGGSDFVFAAIRVGGLRGRQLDEHVALQLGVLGQETTGPGGLSYAIRTLPVMIDIARRVRRLAPEAYLLNFTNPAGIVTEALQDELGDRVLGICDTPSELGRRVAELVDHSGPDHDHQRVELDYVGLNHLGWMRRVLIDGRDVLPDLLADDDQLQRLEETEIFGADWLRSLGMVPNEYLHYYYQNREAVARIRAAAKTRGDQLAATQEAFYRQAARTEDVADLWRAAVAEREAGYMAEAKGGEQGVPAVKPTDDHDRTADPSRLGYAGVALTVMRAISRNEHATAILNVRNRTTINQLPYDAVVEVPTMIDSNGLHPLAVDPPGLSELGLMQQVKAVEQRLIAAVRTGSRQRAVTAFALHPLVDSLAIARQLVDRYCAELPDVAAALPNT